MNQQFDRSFTETTPKSYLSLGPNDVPIAEVPVVGNATDLSIVIMVRPERPGVLISMICWTEFADGRGLSILCRPNGDIYVEERSPNDYLSTSTRDLRTRWGLDIFDGYRHSIAFSCSGPDRSIYVDGENIDVAPTGTASVFEFAGRNTNAEVKIGGRDAASSNSFQGDVFSVGIWQRELSIAAIRRAAFGFINGLDLEMVAYWPLDGTLSDASPNGKDLNLAAPQFHPTVQSIWASTPLRPFRMSDAGRDFQDYSIYHIDGIANHQIGSSTTIVSQHAIRVRSAYLLFGALSGRGPQIEAPADVIVLITGPYGRTYDSEVSTDSVIVKLRNGGVQAFVIKAPDSGTWKIEVRAPSNVEFTFQVQAVPAGGIEAVANGRTTALWPLFMGLDIENQDRPRTRSEGGGMRALLWGLAASALVGLAVAVTASSAIVVSPLIVLTFAAVSVAREVDATMVLGHVQQMNRTDRIAALGQTQDFMLAGQTRKAILLFDAANTSPAGGDNQNADRAYHYRQKYVYPLRTAEAGLKLESRALIAEQLTSENARSLLADGTANYVYVTASGHGLSRALFGWTVPGTNDVLQEIITTSIARELVQGKIFHFLACLTGCVDDVCLGKTLIRLGAKAFIGYTDRYDISNIRVASDSCKADAEIDRVLIGGGTVQEAVQAARDLYESAAKQLESNNVGEPKLAQVVRRNAGLLVTWGDGNATL
jgi:hypothetical protein